MAKKRFGQNFLVDETVIDRMLRAVNPKPDEHFIEIGPGLGALTRPLLASGVKLEVIEIDRDLIGNLKKIQHPNLVVHSQDALTFDFSAAVIRKASVIPAHAGIHVNDRKMDSRVRGNDGALVNNDVLLRVIGNLPYNISSPLLLHCFDHIDQIKDMHFMLQKEVVDRLAAEPNTKDYGRLSIITQYFCQVEKLFEVAPECFDPAPKVTSAVFRLIPRRDRPVIDVEKLELITQHAFGQRRKTLRNSLSKLFTPETLLAQGIDPTRRAETLTLEEYIQLAKTK